MDRISEHVSQWAAGNGVSDCVVAGPLPAINGAVPTLLIAQASKSCDSDGRNFKGAVFYGLEPVAWCCLRSDELESFKAWGGAKFPAARVVIVPDPQGSINCPPPNPQFGVAPREQIRGALKDLAKTWVA
jgi:hypothetical protein